MSSATSLSDTLPSSVPKLDPSGLNWAVFSLRFQDAVEAKGFWSHFDGTSVRPTPTTTTPAPMTEGAAAPALVVDDNSAEVAQWDKDERSAKTH